ncbi:MAG: CPBP family intramembrane glutamic endopeptidase [Opitutales bacterium]
MSDDPILILLYLVAAVYVVYEYWSDYKAQRDGTPSPTAMPGAVAPGLRSVYLIGIAGALLLLACETGGELALGIAGEQSKIVWYVLFAWLAAGIVEEVIFRGFLVVENHGRAALIGSCIGFSLLFALAHAHFWDLEEGFKWTFTAKAWFTTSILFANSLWFYAVRFGPWNPRRSIFPCMLAHAASNLGVFGVKLFQGYVVF